MNQRGARIDETCDLLLSSHDLKDYYLFLWRLKCVLKYTWRGNCTWKGIRTPPPPHPFAILLLCCNTKKSQFEKKWGMRLLVTPTRRRTIYIMRSWWHSLMQCWCFFFPFISTLLSFNLPVITWVLSLYYFPNLLLTLWTNFDWFSSAVRRIWISCFTRVVPEFLYRQVFEH